MSDCPACANSYTEFGLREVGIECLQSCGQKDNRWLNSHGIKFITKDEWLPNSPELAPMDYFANDHLKQMTRKRLYTTARGMIRAAKEEWSKIPLEMFQNALLAWPERIDLVNKAKGNRVAL